MNRIDVAFERTDPAEDEHLVLLIDGQRLDMLLSDISPEDQLEGLVPALLPWIDNAREHEIVWQRFLPKDAKRHRTPVLMCPEHRDLFCTTIVAEVRVTGDQVEWRRVGIDDTPEEDLPELIGQDVYWFRDVGPFVFARDEYLRAMEAFRQNGAPASVLH